jgi:hypothetical protein
MTELRTVDNLMPASSSTFCTRLTNRARSCTRAVRVRVRSRRSCCSWLGTKLGVIRPCWSKVAIHSASPTSVFLAFNGTDQLSIGHNQLDEAFQASIHRQEVIPPYSPSPHAYTPLPATTLVQPKDLPNHLRKVRISFRRFPASTIIRHTTRKRRCTSMPAHR